jgi:3-hydroxyisobutyrate dehydrogenase-like beta-hydroxyacid dehydrogenase
MRRPASWGAEAKLGWFEIVGSRSNSRPTTIGVLGLGEAGSALASDLARAGAVVRGFDPAPRHAEGVDVTRTADEAVEGVDLVLAVTPAASAHEAAESAAPHLGSGQMYADASTAAPGLKRELEAVVAPTGATFADLALLGTVPGRGLRTPALVSGPGAEAVVSALAPLGMPVESLGSETGAASTRKLVRSVFMKGLAAAIGESLAAGRAAGCEDWIAGEIEETLNAADSGLFRRLVEGSRRHAVRRVDEMAAARALLVELGVEPRVTRAAEEWLAELALDAHGQQVARG